MGLVNSRLSARRFRVAGELPDGFRELYRDHLQGFSFVEPPVVDKAEVEGWVHINDVTKSDFDDFNKWFLDSWIFFGLRIDKRVLPAKLFRATLQSRCQTWAEEHDVSRCPSSIKTELKEALEIEWLHKTMPRTQHHEICWNIHTDVLYVSTHGDAACDRIRRRFFRTFGRRLVPFSPLEWVAEDEDLVASLLAQAPLRIKKGGDQ